MLLYVHSMYIQQHMHNVLHCVYLKKFIGSFRGMQVEESIGHCRKLKNRPRAQMSRCGARIFFWVKIRGCISSGRAVSIGTGASRMYEDERLITGGHGAPATSFGVTVLGKCVPRLPSNKVYTFSRKA